MIENRRAPVQGDTGYHLPIGHSARPKDAHPPGTISWVEHEEAWRDYARRYGTDQSAERIAQRAGFSYGELVEYLGHAPVTWEPLQAKGGGRG